MIDLCGSRTKTSLDPGAKIRYDDSAGLNYRRFVVSYRMKILQVLAFSFIGIYFLGILLLFVFQTRLIFYPRRLSRVVKFDLRPQDEEVFIKCADGVIINGIFYRGDREDVVLYFHGNAGDLSGWQFVAEDFYHSGFSVLVIDYRGYGKSEGKISEKGFYADAEAAYGFLVQKKDFNPQDIIIYGRSVGSGVAVHLAATYPNKGLVLEAPYSSLGALADSKVPFFFPSVYLRYQFNNERRINSTRAPLIVVHGSADELIPPSEGKILYDKFKGRKEFVLVNGGAHNDLGDFPAYQHFLTDILPNFFDKE
jgi:pimeloyl-ACP methyl ester carboxylesterase